MAPAAEELRFLATTNSAVYGRPGLVSDEYLDELDGGELGHPGADPAVLAAELCGAESAASSPVVHVARAGGTAGGGVARMGRPHLLG